MRRKLSFKKNHPKITGEYTASYDKMIKRIQRITGWSRAESAGALICIDSNIVIEKGRIENYYVNADGKEIISNLKACGYL